MIVPRPPFSPPSSFFLLLHRQIKFDLALNDEKTSKQVEETATDLVRLFRLVLRSFAGQILLSILYTLQRILFLRDGRMLSLVSLNG